jgi:hypothetical protein
MEKGLMNQTQIIKDFLAVFIILAFVVIIVPAAYRLGQMAGEERIAEIAMIIILDKQREIDELRVKLNACENTDNTPDYPPRRNI